MPRPSFAETLRRVVLLQLSVLAPGLVACGGATATSSTSGDGGASDGATGPEGSTPAEAGGTCQVTGPSVSVSTGSCSYNGYPFDGTAASCFGGSAPTAQQCLVLCDPGDAAILLGCSLMPCGQGPIPQCSTGTMLLCDYGSCVAGRRSAGLRDPRARRHASPAARFLSRMAYFEAASVTSFARLERELEALGAPRSLRRGARRAMRDEVRHARVASALAAREGAPVRTPEGKAGRVRSLEAIARENAVEGCVHERFAAALTVAQSVRATDAKVRAAMKRVAADELRHAELAHEVARWSEARLAPAARRRITAARRRALDALLAETSGGAVPADLTGRLGLPTAEQARAIARSIVALDCLASLASWR